MNERWIGVDFDGTLCIADPHGRTDCIGEPIGIMVARVKRWVAQGIKVKIMTARWHLGVDQIKSIQDWLELYGMPRLEVTATKDLRMIELWDDRAVQVIPDTGVRADGKYG